MKVTNPGDRVFLACVGEWVEHRQEVEVDAADGDSLVEQGWISARSKAAKRVARKRAAVKKDPVPVKAQQAEPEPATAEQED
jgi:hypothetical protein